MEKQHRLAEFICIYLFKFGTKNKEFEEIVLLMLRSGKGNCVNIVSHAAIAVLRQRILYRPQNKI